MEGVGFAFADCCAALDACGSLPSSAYVAGGGSQSDTWLQMLANITGLTLNVPDSGAQGAALGAARLAMLARGDGTETEVLSSATIEKTYKPDPLLTEEYADGLHEFRSAWR